MVSDHLKGVADTHTEAGKFPTLGNLSFTFHVQESHFFFFVLNYPKAFS